jgi:hypothetical protein
MLLIQFCLMTMAVMKGHRWKPFIGMCIIWCIGMVFGYTWTAIHGVEPSLIPIIVGLTLDISWCAWVTWLTTRRKELNR